MDRVRILNEIDKSVLPNSLKIDALDALNNGEIVLGQEAIENGLVPKIIAAGSFDPATYGHRFILERARSIDPNAGIIVVSSTSKDKNYQLFTPIERAALIRSYGLRMRIILGFHDTPEQHSKVLKELHQIPEIIIKGRRNPLDSRHTASLIPKYNISEESIFEIQSPDELADVSSGNIKGEVWAEVMNKGEILGGVEYIRRSVSDLIYVCVKEAIKKRDHDSNHIFKKRLEAGSSEALFG